MSKRTAIKAYCRECAGGTYLEVIVCHLSDCPLWPYRTGYGPSVTAKSVKQALIRHPDIAKELATLGLDACFSQGAIKKPALWRGKSTRTDQTTGVKGKEVESEKQERLKAQGDALGAGTSSPLAQGIEGRRRA